MKKPYHIVFTTIYHPVVLHDLFDNISKFGHLNKTCIWIVGDRKTPESVHQLALEINKKGLEVEYLHLESQVIIGKNYGEFYRRLPFDNETRRNIGYLKALEHGCEVLISIDDDNFPVMEDDFIGFHSKTGTNWGGNLISEDKGFHNICEYLVFEPERHIHPRGFPFHLRSTKNSHIHKQAKTDSKIGITAGLWLIEPDIDATTWLNGKVHAKEYKGDNLHVLSQDTWTPVNTQNTSVVRDLIPAYLCIPMGHDVPGGKINRYGDIWGGYFLQALMNNTDYHVAFGRPLVEHRRNPHNYVDDLRHEYWGMMLTDWLLGVLKNNFKAKSLVMTERVMELADFLDKETLNNLPIWCPEEMKTFLRNTSENLREWSYACEIAMKK